jgi:hypothetical protein
MQGTRAVQPGTPGVCLDHASQDTHPNTAEPRSTGSRVLETRPVPLACWNQRRRTPAIRATRVGRRVTAPPARLCDPKPVPGSRAVPLRATGIGTVPATVTPPVGVLFGAGSAIRFWGWRGAARRVRPACSYTHHVLVAQLQVTQQLQGLWRCHDEEVPALCHFTCDEGVQQALSRWWGWCGVQGIRSSPPCQVGVPLPSTCAPQHSASVLTGREGKTLHYPSRTRVFTELSAEEEALRKTRVWLAAD